MKKELLSQGPLRRRVFRMLLWLGGGLLVFIAVGGVVTSVAIRLIEQRQTLESTAELMALSAGAALVFDDREAAVDILATLRTHPDAVYARLTGLDGNVVAEWGTSADPSLLPETRPVLEAYGLQTLAFAAVHLPVAIDGDPVGWIFLQYTMDMVYQRLARLGLALLGVLGAGLVIAYIVSGWCADKLTVPVQRLTGFVLQASSQPGDASRAVVETQDEVGVLAEGINHMLDRIAETSAEVDQNLAFLKKLLNSIPMPIYFKDRELCYRGVNRLFCEQVIGRPEEEILGKTIEALCPDHPELLEAIQFRVRDLLDGFPHAPVQCYESQATYADGQEHTVQFIKTVYTDADGEPVGIIGVMNDVTEIRNIEKELVNATAHEQQRIARDLHDDLGQMLTAASYKARLIVLALGQSLPAVSGQLEEVIDLVNSSAQKTRQIARGLNPVELEDSAGLAEALQLLAERTEAMCEITCRITCDDRVPDLSDFAANNLFRIAQEAINNAVKHADASRIDLRLALEDHHLILTIGDNGRRKWCLKTRLEDPLTGQGLRIMRHRVNLLQGQFECIPNENSGTIISCRIPLRAIVRAAPAPEPGETNEHG